MAIVQEKRMNVAQPAVERRDYGAEYVTAATVSEVTSVEPEKEAEEPDVVEEAVAAATLPPSADLGGIIDDEPKKKKGGRPKKK